VILLVLDCAREAFDIHPRISGAIGSARERCEDAKHERDTANDAR
jgi:hypothetical protein